MSIPDHSLCYIRVHFQSLPHCPARTLYPILLEQPQDTPYTGPGAILVQRLNIDVALPLERLSAGAELATDGAGFRVTVDRGRFGAFFIVQDDRDGDLGPSRPLWAV